MNENRREFLIRSGKVGVAGLATALMIQMYGRDKLIKLLSQKDPNLAVLGVDFTAYGFNIVKEIGDKLIDLKNWELKLTNQGIFIYCESRNENFPSALKTWVENTYFNMVSYMPFYGELYHGKIKFIINKFDVRDTDDLRGHFEKKHYSDLKSDIFSNAKSRNLIVKISNNPNDYSMLNYESKCVKCDIDLPGYILRRCNNTVSDFIRMNNDSKDNFIFEIPYGKGMSDKLKFLYNEKTKEYGTNPRIALSFKEDQVIDYNSMTWDLKKFTDSIRHDEIDIIIIEDVLSDLYQLKKNMVHAREVAGMDKSIVIRLVFGFPRCEKFGYNNIIEELSKRMETVLEGDANGYLLNDYDGTWLFTGTPNPFVWGEIERMVRSKHSKYFGISSG